MIDAIKSSTLATLLLFTLIGCTAPGMSDSEQSLSIDGLKKIKSKKMDEVWVKPGFDPDTYTQIMFHSAGISYRPVKHAGPLSNTKEFPISAENQARLQTVVADAFKAELTQINEYRIASKVGPDILLLNVGLSDVVSNVPEDSFGRGGFYVSEFGSATLVLEFRDSESGALLVRAADRRAAEVHGRNLQKSSSGSNWAEVERAAKRWARGLRRGIDEMRAVTE